MTTRIPTGAIDLFVLGSVGGLHVPIEPILQTEGIVLILYPLELFLAATQRPRRVDEVRLGFGDEPVGQGGRDVS